MSSIVMTLVAILFFGVSPHLLMEEHCHLGMIFSTNISTPRISSILTRLSGMLDEYKVNWIILPPTEPLTKALARSALWDQVYSDRYAVVFVRHLPIVE